MEEKEGRDEGFLVERRDFFKEKKKNFLRRKRMERVKVKEK